MNDLLEALNGDLIRKYEQIRSPYYTTYTTGGEWDSDFDHSNYADALKQSTSPVQKVPLALYIHFPYCPELCYYCCCIKTISKNRERITVYLDYLHREIDLLLSHFDDLGVEPKVREIHFGGGTPTYMKRHEFEGLFKKLRTFVDLKNFQNFGFFRSKFFNLHMIFNENFRKFPSKKSKILGPKFLVGKFSNCSNFKAFTNFTFGSKAFVPELSLVCWYKISWPESR